MSSICVAGSEIRPGVSPGRIWFDDGVFCQILGAKHPLCRVPDRIWFALADALNVADPKDSPRAASKFLWSFAKAFSQQALEAAALGGIQISELCADPPQIPDQQITYIDLIRFLMGVDSSLLQKLFDWWKFEKWFEYCQCRATVEVLPPVVAPPPLPTLPLIPFCGGFAAGPPPSAIQNCLAPLLLLQQEILEENAAQGADFWNFADQVLAGDPYQLLVGDHWILGDHGYTGSIGRGFVLEQIGGPTPCPQEFPYHTPVFPHGLRVTCEDPAGKIEIAISGTARQWIVQRIQRAETDMLPDNPSRPIIPQGTVLSSFEREQWSEPLSLCFYSRITPFLPDCPQGGRSAGQSWTDGISDSPTDDQELCLAFPSVCSYKTPDCCGGGLVLLTPQEQLNVAEALGFNVSHLRT